MKLQKPVIQWLAVALALCKSAIAQDDGLSLEREGALKTEAIEELLLTRRSPLDELDDFSITIPETAPPSTPAVGVGPARPGVSAGFGPERVIGPVEEKAVIEAFARELGDRGLVEQLLAETKGPCADARKAYADELKTDPKFVLRRSRPDLVRNLDVKCSGAPQSAGAPWWAGVAPRIGVLIDAAPEESHWGRGVDIFCTAFALDRKTVVTAAHCAYEPAATKSWSGLRRPDHVLFVPAAAPTSAFEVAKAMTPAGAAAADKRYSDEEASDVIYLELRTPLTMTLDPLAPGESLSPRSPLLIVGFNPELAYFSTAVGEDAPLRSLARPADKTPLTPADIAAQLPADWTRFLRYDPRAMCRAWAVIRNKCVLHTCSTVGGFSGAPTFARMGDAVTYIGPHAGVISSSSSEVHGCGGSAVLGKNGVNFSVAVNGLASVGDRPWPDDR